ncbi:MAG: hypothetical protein AVDCRST_MAG04-2175, partial [uncultured Acetobacteraceae bacterium]
DEPYAVDRHIAGARRPRGRRPGAFGSDIAPPRQRVARPRHQRPLRGGRRLEPAAGSRPARVQGGLRLPDLGSAPPRRADRDAFAHGRQRRAGRLDQRGPAGWLGRRRLLPRQSAQHGAPARAPRPEGPPAAV